MRSAFSSREDRASAARGALKPNECICVELAELGQVSSLLILRKVACEDLAVAVLQRKKLLGDGSLSVCCSHGASIAASQARMGSRAWGVVDVAAGAGPIAAHGGNSPTAGCRFSDAVSNAPILAMVTPAPVDTRSAILGEHQAMIVTTEVALGAGLFS